MTDPTPLPPAIVRGRIQELRIYEVTLEELDLLERGSPDSAMLNLAIFFGTAAISLTLALVTTTPPQQVFIVFVVIATVAAAAALILAVIWWRSRVSVRAVATRIRNRLPPQEGERLED